MTPAERDLLLTAARVLRAHLWDDGSSKIGELDNAIEAAELESPTPITHEGKVR